MKPAFFSPSNATLWIASLTALSLATAGCASIRSTELPAKNRNGNAVSTQGGMIYYLPKQRLKLTMTVADGKDGKSQTRTISLEQTSAYADNTARYVAQYRRNHIGSNTLKIGVNVDGLLSGENLGSNTPQIAEFLGQLAAGPKLRIDQAKGRDEENKGCALAGTYEWVFDAAPFHASRDDHPGKPLGERKLEARSKGMIEVGNIDSDNLPCGLYVTINNFSLMRPSDPTNAWRDVYQNDRGGRYGYGYFYRQRRPVQVTVSSDDGQRREFLFSLVDQHSPIEFLPIPLTLFAEATWKVTFTDGSPTVYDVNAGGDVLGLAKLPADVLKAYSEAFTTGLKDREDIAAAEAQYLKQLALLAAQQAKYEACRAAAEGEDLDKIKAACN